MGALVAMRRGKKGFLKGIAEAAAPAVATFSRFRPRYYDGELTLKFMTKEISRWHLLSLVAGAQKLSSRAQNPRRDAHLKRCNLFSVSKRAILCVYQ